MREFWDAALGIWALIGGVIAAGGLHQAWAEQADPPAGAIFIWAIVALPLVLLAVGRGVRASPGPRSWVASARSRVQTVAALRFMISGTATALLCLLPLAPLLIAVWPLAVLGSMAAGAFVGAKAWRATIRQYGNIER